MKSPSRKSQDTETGGRTNKFPRWPPSMAPGTENARGQGNGNQQLWRRNMYRPLKVQASSEVRKPELHGGMARFEGSCIFTPVSMAFPAMQRQVLITPLNIHTEPRRVGPKPLAARRSSRLPLTLKIGERLPCPLGLDGKGCKVFLDFEAVSRLAIAATSCEALS